MPAPNEYFTLKQMLCLGYFLLFAAAGATFPFLPVFFFSFASFSESQIGLIFAMQKVVGSLVTPALSHFADVWEAHRSIFVSACILSAIAQGCLYFAAQADANDRFLAMVLLCTLETGTLAAPTLNRSLNQLNHRAFPLFRRYELTMLVCFFTALFGTYTPLADSFATVAMGSPTEYGKVTCRP